MAPERWYYRRWGVLLLLFVVLGPLGLPFLWRSPRFSRGGKALLTLATLAYTVWLATLTVASVRLVLRQVPHV